MYLQFIPGQLFYSPPDKIWNFDVTTYLVLSVRDNIITMIKTTQENKNITIVSFNESLNCSVSWWHKNLVCNTIVQNDKIDK